MKLLKLLPALIFFILALSYTARSQGTGNPQPQCYGVPILLTCNYTTGCSYATATIHWENTTGSWSTSERDPVLWPKNSPQIGDGQAALPSGLCNGVGYATDKFYLAMQFGPPPDPTFYGGRVSITILDSIHISGNPTPVQCFGTSTGAITITVNGGHPPYSFNWSNGASTQNLSGLNAGNYSVTVTDSNNPPCSQASNTFVVGGPPAAIVVIGDPHNTLCMGSCEGYVNLVTVSGGTPSYTYIWSNLATTRNVSALCAGNYTVTVTDNHLCTKTGSWTVSSPGEVSWQGIITDVTCKGLSNGAITTVFTSGGTPPYTYHWSNGATTANLTGLPAATYSITVTDSHGCDARTSRTVNEPPLLTVLPQATITPPTCSNGTNGAITITVTGGTPSYTFIWSNGKTTQNITGLSAGTFTVTVTDSHSCMATGSWQVIPPIAVTVIGVPFPESCFGGSNGYINITPAGGTTPYTFLWSNGKTTQNITGLPIGAYTVTVSDLNTCTATGSWLVTQPLALVVTGDPHNTLCMGSCDGYVNLLTVSGGTPNYTYVWSNLATTRNVSSLCAGNYTVTVTDNNLCTKTGSWTISSPGEVSWQGIIIDVTCKGLSNGAITTVFTSGGTPPYTYHWSNGATTANLTGLPAATYSITVIDSHGCDARTSRTVNEPPLLSVLPQPVITPPLCFSSSNGAINITVTGGTPAYTFIWSNGKTTEDISGLSAGSYCVTVTDNHSCSTSGCWQVVPPTAVTVTGVPSAAACFGDINGSITITPSGGTPGYTFIWSNGKTTQNITGLPLGTYTVTVTDTHTCTATGSWQVTQPLALVVTGDPHNTLCMGSCDGYVNLVTVSGGTPSYTYVWSNLATTRNISSLCAGNYTVTVTDNNLCKKTGSWTVSSPGEVSWQGIITDVTCKGLSNGTITTVFTSGGTPPYTYHWSNGATTANLTGLPAATYSITVIDSHGCDARTSRTVNEPPLLSILPQPVITPPLCYSSSNGAITITVTGGTPSYTFIWSNGKTTQNISGLSGGSYCVTVTDNHSCTAMGCWEVIPPTAVTVPGVPSPASCYGGNNGSIDITPAGGTPGYTFMWSNGKTTEDLTGLYAGVYTVTVSDSHSCTAMGSWQVTQPTAIVVTGVPVDALCKGSCNGYINTTVTGGTPGYTYAWSNGPSTENVSGLCAGTYTVTVTDTHSCTGTGSWIIGEPGEVSWQGVTTDVTCKGLCNGTITTVFTSGGTPPYSYHWNNGATTANLTGLCKGTYYVTVTDSHTCDARSFRAIYEPDSLAVLRQAVIVNAKCYKGNEGSIDITVTGGTLAYAFIWSNGKTTEDITGLTAGCYTVTVTDSHSCTATGSYCITEPPWWSIGIEGPMTVCCNTSTTNTLYTYNATISGTYGPPITYEWVIEGGTIISGQNSPSVTVQWTCCGSGKVWLTVSQGPIPCTLITYIPITITPTPVPVIIGPVSVIANDIDTYCVQNGDPTHLYTWTIQGGVITAGWGTPCITIQWGDYPICGCGQVTVCESTQITPGVPGCTGCTTLFITMLPNVNGINLSGTVYYKNNILYTLTPPTPPVNGTPLNGVTVKLRNLATNLIVATTTTGPNMNPPYTGDPGYYAFMNVPVGNYRLEATFNGTWGGNNATDALLIQLEAMAPPHVLFDLYRTVADVNGSGTVTGLDALYVKLRTVGSISSYPAGDWAFENPNITIPVLGFVNFAGLCEGDVNGSYIPAGMKDVSFLSVVDDRTQTIPVEETFNYQIRSSRAAELGAMTLFMDYNKERFEVLDVTTSLNDGLKYIIDDGKVAIAWSDTRPFSVKNDDPIFMLTVKAKAPVAEASQIFNVITGSEFADPLGNRYDNFDLKMAKVITPDGAQGFSMYNYPNPFTNSTTIVYTLPESSKVKLVITNMFGKTLRTLVDESQIVGTHSITVNSADLNLTSGVFLYRIEATGSTDTYTKINKMIFTH